MKKSFIFSLIFILFFSSLLSADNVSTLDVGNSNPEVDYVPGELLVKYKTQFRTTASSFYKNNWNISTIQTFKSTGCQHVKLPQGMTVEQAMDMYQNDPNVEYAEPNYIYHATLTPNDARFVSGDLWGLYNFGQNVNGTSGTSGADIDAINAWDATTGDTGVIIAVVDSGVKYDHEDLIGNIWSNAGEIPGNSVDDDGNGRIDDIRGWDFVDGDNDPMDYSGHGTHVAGTIAAVGNNGTGVTGVCWTAKIMPIRGLDAAGSGWTTNLILAIEYANSNGAHIINNSWGGGGESSALRNAINVSSAVVVCAAGNSNVNTDTIPHYPSSYTSTNIISVAATDQNDNRASFSNYGTTSVDVGAPGTNIYSTVITRIDSINIDDFNRASLGTNWTTWGTNNTWGIENNTLADGPSIDYSNNTESYAQFGPVDLSGLSGLDGPRLDFLLRGITEYGYDYLAVQLSSDGLNWTDHNYIHGTYSLWDTIETDINSYAGGNMYIRFYFYSDSTINDEGFQIDDLKITVLTTTDNAYTYYNGTSMAAPIVSGIAGLIKATTPAITNTEIKAAIEQNVDTIPSLSGWVATGGRVNAGNIFPVAPTVLSATVVSGTQINLTWTDNSSNEDGFRIERKTGAGGTWAEIATLGANTTTYSNTGISELTNYYYRVCAYHTGVNSPYSNEDDATTPLGAPTNLDASTFSASDIDLIWTDNSNIETGFRIERADVSGGPFTDIGTVGANITEYRDTTLPNPSTSYYYRVRAYNGGDNSAYSNEENATTLAADAPSELTATAVSFSRINLTWNDNSTEDGFRIERKIGVGGTYAQIGTVESNVETYSDTGLSALAECFYRIFSYNAGGDLAQSNEASATTQAAASGVVDGGGGGGGGTCFISTSASGL